MYPLTIRLAVCLVVTLKFFSSVNAAVVDGDVSVTFVARDGNRVGAFTYDGRRHETTTSDCDFWTLSRGLARVNRVNDSTWKATGDSLNISDCKPVAELMDRFGLKKKNSLVLPSQRFKEKGLVGVGVTVTLNSEYEEQRVESEGRLYNVPMSAAVMYLQLIYDGSNDSWTFVDSLLGNPGSSGGQGYSFGPGRFDNVGTSFYYRKRNQAMRFNIAASTYDTLSGGNMPRPSSNSDDLLLLDTKRRELHLLDDSDRVVSTVPSDLEMIYDVGRVSEGVFLVAGWEWGLFKTHRTNAIMLVDFPRHDVVILTEVSGIIEFLDIRVGSSGEQ